MKKAFFGSVWIAALGFVVPLEGSSPRDREYFVRWLSSQGIFPAKETVGISGLSSRVLQSSKKTISSSEGVWGKIEVEFSKANAACRCAGVNDPVG